MKRKYKIIEYVTAILCAALLAGCSGHGRTDDTAAGTEMTSAHTTAAAATAGEGGTETTAVTTDAPLGPITLETPAGAVITGTIVKDSDGWYLVPDRTLNITLTLGADHREKFEDQTRIAIPEVDKFNLNGYRNETVTVTGMLQNYRGAGKLYIYPCLIEHGRTVSEICAMPTLEYPQEGKSQGEYDPSVPLPEKMKPTVRDGRYVYNPYFITKNTLEKMGNAYTDFYIGFVDAWFSYKTSCPCPDKFYADTFTSVMFYEFPLFSADGEYDMRTGYDSVTQTLNWSYTSKSRAEHDRLISEFEADANKILAAVDPTAGEQMRAQALYHAFCPLMTYDSATMVTGAYHEPYYAYTLGRGVCITFAGALAQLFGRVGLEATIATGDCTLDPAGHAWSVVKVNGKNYFCDATYELGYKNGSAYVYYGMTMADRLADGTIIADSITIGGMNQYKPDKTMISDTPLAVR